MNIIFRSDASHTIGTGHIVRCLTLADKLASFSHECSFVTQPLPEALKRQILERKHKILSLFPSENLKDTSNLLRITQKTSKDSILVIDHYGLSDDYEKHLREHFRKIVVIDDLEREHFCDLLIDPNYRASRKIYDSQKVKKVLQGPLFCLLREDFTQNRTPLIFDHKTKTSILCFFGGSDENGETLKYLKACQSLALKNVQVHFLVAGSNKFIKEIQSHSEIQNTHIHIQPSNLCKLIQSSDVYVGSGGTFTWERMCLGLTGIVVSVAENQHLISKNLSENGYQIYLGPAGENEPKDVLIQAQSLLLNPQKLIEMSQKCQTLIDGLGCDRVVQEILSLNT